jgi:hypothetical protein
MAKVSGDSAVSEWNKWAKDPIGMLVKQIYEDQKVRRRLRQETYIDVSEYAADLVSALAEQNRDIS